MNGVPVTFSYFHSFDLEIEYSVGLKKTGMFPSLSISISALSNAAGTAIRPP